MIQYRRAVSPIVAMMLIIIMTVAGAAAVAVIYNNFVTDDNTFDTTNATTLNAQTQSDINATLEITKLARMPDATFFSSIDLTVDFYGPEPYIYVFDIDLVVDGIKLDTYAEWTIVSWGDAERTVDQNNQFTGYKQAKGTSVVYKVNLTDSSNIFARLGITSGFDYEVVVGTEQGVVSAVLKNIQLSTNIFNDVTYKVALLHYKQTFTDTASVINQLQTLLINLNGTNKIYFLFNNATDIYDTSTGLNGTYIGETYDIVINAEWAINLDVETEYQKIYDLATPMVFLGALDTLYADGKVANSTTYDITGNWYTPDTATYNSRYSLVSNYTVSSALDPIISSIRGTTGSFSTTLSSLLSIGWTNASRSDMIRYGIINYDLYYTSNPRSTPELVNQYLGGLLSLRKQNLTANHREVITMPYDNRIMDTSFRDILWRNVILTIVLEPERVAPQATILVNSDTNIYVKDSPGNNYYFDLVLNFTITEGDIEDGSLILDYQLPTSYDITDGTYSVYVRAGDQAPVISSVAIGASNAFTLNISSLISGNIVQNTQISVKIVEIKVRMPPGQNTCKEWQATFSFNRLDSTSGTVNSYSNKKIPLSSTDTSVC